MAAAAEMHREAGNECMANGDYVNALRSYSLAISAAPKDAALYSNRSFSFLRLNLAARALADAEEAVKRRPDWAKAHFRRGAALSLGGLHEDALAAFKHASALDPSDTHLQAQCGIEGEAASRQRKWSAATCALGALLGLVLLGLLLLAPEPAKPAKMPKPSSAAGASVATSVAMLVLGAALGALGGYAADLLRKHNRRGEMLPPMVSNERFAAMQMPGAPKEEARGPAGGLGGIVGGLGMGGGVAEAPVEAARSDAAGTRETKGPRSRSTKHGRAAALKAAGKLP